MTTKNKLLLVRSLPVVFLLAAVSATVFHSHRLIARDERVRWENDALRQALDYSNTAIVHLNASGQITAWSAGAEKLTGVSSASALGRDISFLIPLQMRQAHSEAFSHRMGTKQSVIQEITCNANRLSGETTTEFAARIIVWAHPPHGAVAIIFEASDVKQLQEDGPLLDGQNALVVR